MIKQLEEVSQMRIPEREKDNLARKVKVLNRAEVFDPRLSRIYYTELSELPDAVKNHPHAAQRAYLVTFNNLLRKTGDQPKAMRGAWKALRNKVSQLNDMKRRAHNRGGVDEGLIHWGAKRLVQGPKVQIVVP